MIDRRDILESASRLGILANVVEKVYVLGWILGGINNHPALADSWVFKGGTCLKKCFFETYRFSEDLDFTLQDERHLDEKFLKTALQEVAAWVMEESGLTMSAAQIGIDIYTNPRGKLSCQGKIGYRGPVSPSSGGWPKIKLDLTADEKIVLPSTRRQVFQPYSDTPESGLWINCYAYEEAFAEKIRALGERTRPRDLYDVVNLYRHADSRPSASVLLNVLQQKCAHKSISVPTLEALADHRAELEVQWQSMLGHQLPFLPPVANYWDELPAIFDWLMSRAEAPLRAPYHLAHGETAVRSRLLPVAIPLKSHSFMEIIRFAAGNQLCVDLTYKGEVRRIEPYSLRQTADRNFVLHAIRCDSREHRSYRLDRIDGASVTQQSFSPSYLIELTPGGLLPVLPSASRQSHTVGSTRRRPSSSIGRGPVYVYRCPMGDKTFDRTTRNPKLNPHKHPDGYPCRGRVGAFVETK